MAPAGRASPSEGQRADRLRLAGAASGIINRCAGFGGRPTPETAPAREPDRARQRLDRASASLRVQTGQTRKRAGLRLGVPCQAFPPGALQAESAESACAWKEAFAWESVAASPPAPAPGALCGPSGLRLRALASGLRALPRRLSSPGEESCPEGLPHYACRSPSPLAPAPAARSEWERREERGRAIQGWTSDVVPSGSRPEPSVLGTFVLDSPSKVPFTSFWGPWPARTGFSRAPAEAESQ